MAQQGIYINGHLYSAASCEIDIDGSVYLGVTSLTFDDELTPEDQYGTPSVAMGRTKGQYKASGEMEVPQHEADLIIAKLTAKAGAGRGYGEVAFNISGSYFESGTGTSTVEIVGARIIKVGDAMASGAAGQKRKFSLSIIQPIKRNGASIVSNDTANFVTLGAVSAVSAAALGGIF